MAKRSEQLLEIVNQNKKIEVNRLAELLQVSKVTIRKDLTELEQRGLLQRRHGYAIINNPDNLSFRLAQNYDTKVKIAKLAAAQVTENETIMIESGSTCALLAEQLGRQKKHVTIITNSYFIANFVEKFDNIEIMLLGGEYQANAEVVVGPLAKMLLPNFHVKKLFVGTDGFAADTGFFSNDLMRAEIVQAMAQQSDQAIILTDSSKFSSPGVVKQLPLSAVATVITDQQIPTIIRDLLEQKKIDLRLA
ncbi:DeoR/GlpR family DNA-binding transcription regulator [Loigolactobacillus jiayinensis]|uniref:Lactose phosphotransferase system repressor n=1 Tax=Loigolactobacillus jiayinensis TaxID=2486016 RepID=A0ABW1RE20_9LACO|nr:DeoR/GlpR family DNA-binding transcription regulator [Loigolactobacillus jiayinensis]